MIPVATLLPSDTERAIVVDIAFAAAEAAMNSLLLKVNTLPDELKLTTTVVALKLIGGKLDSLGQAIPEVVQFLSDFPVEIAVTDADRLRQALRKGGA